MAAAVKAEGMRNIKTESAAGINTRIKSEANMETKVKIEQEE